MKFEYTIIVAIIMASWAFMVWALFVSTPEEPPSCARVVSYIDGSKICEINLKSDADINNPKVKVSGSDVL